MKKFVLYPLISLFVLIIIAASVIFVRPVLILNPKNLAYLLQKTAVLKEWHWDNANFTHEWISWNERKFSGSFEGICLEYDHAAVSLDTCFTKISWDLNVIFSLTEGVRVKTLAPFRLLSPLTEVSIKPSQKKESSGAPPDIWKYWSMLWGDMIPDMEFEFKKIIVHKDKKTFEFDLGLKKSGQSLLITSLDFILDLNPKGFNLFAPIKYPIHTKLPLAKQPIYLHDFRLVGKVMQEGIDLRLKGLLEGIVLRASTYIDLPLKHDFSSPEFKKKALLKTKATAELKNVKETIFKYAPRPYHILPAPFNVMDGRIFLEVEITSAENPNQVQVKALNKFHLTSSKQALIFDVSGEIPLDVRDFSRGVLTLGVNFEKVILQLPRFSKQSPPPQFIPDGRFKKNVSETKEKKTFKYSVDLVALNEAAMNIRTDLLDEMLRLNFNLSVDNGKLVDGFIKVLPLKTTIFKRPIRVENFFVDFDQSREPLVEGTIKFPLPEYKITLKLEGPISKPRYSFQSEPPLPEKDIYAVLLFGRPLEDLNPEDKTAANKTNQLLSQGVLSLSVLYFLAGSPVEYVGYDPNSKNATAQFGLGKKSSLRVGGGSDGVNSTAVRRSLGKGWYLDTSVQKSTNTTNSEGRNYGVLLERIISY